MTGVTSGLNPFQRKNFLSELFFFRSKVSKDQEPVDLEKQTLFMFGKMTFTLEVLCAFIAIEYFLFMSKDI